MRLHWWTVGLLLAARVAAAESRLPAGLEDLFTRWVTVTADEIERSGATTLEEYLVRLPYFTGGGFGRFDVADGAGRAVADLRFLSPQRTLVLIDGHRSVGTRGVVDLNSIPLSAVERVEIDLRSSQATAGPEAIAGVINIVTRDPIGARAGLMSGITPDTDGEQLLTAVSIGDERWSVSAQYLLRRELGADQTRWDAGRLETFGALGSGSWALGEGVELYLDSQFNQRASRQRLLPELIDSERGTAPLFLAQDASTFRILTGVAGRLGDWSMDVFTGGGQSNVALETRNSVDTLDDELSIELARESETQFMLGGDFAGPLFELPAGAADLRLGFLFRDERWVERGGGGDRTGGFDAFEVFGGLVAPVVTGAEISVAGRLSDFSSVGNVFAYEVRGSHQPLDGLQLRLGFGRGLRAPNTNELYAGVAERTLSAFDPCEVAVSVEACRADGRPSGAPLGNPLLEPEIHRFFEGGLALTLPVVPGFELSLSTDVYNTQIDEAVRVDPESGSLVNDGRLESSGFDLRADLHFDFPANSAASHLDLGWQMDYLHRLKLSGFRALDRTFVDGGNVFPRQRWLMFASLEFNGLFGVGARKGVSRLDQRLRFVGSTSGPSARANPLEEQSATVGSAYYWDVSVSYRVSAVRVAVGVDNILGTVVERSETGETGVRPNTYDFVGRYLYLRATYDW